MTTRNPTIMIWSALTLTTMRFQRMHTPIL
jgi:hypothetical protein